MWSGRERSEPADQRNLAGLFSTTRVSGAREREHASQTLATSRPVGVTDLGGRGWSARILERNLAGGLEALLLSHGRPCMCRRDCLRRGPSGGDRRHRDPSPCSGLAHCLRTEAGDPRIQARRLDWIGATGGLMRLAMHRCPYRTFRAGNYRTSA